MGFKYVFNGYFRSGTTLIWSILQKSNPDYKVFYEPLHFRLVQNINNFREKNGNFKTDPLHDKALWKEYVQEGEKFIKKLKDNKCLEKDLYPASKEELFKYIDIYEGLEKKLILQTNRLHFHLKSIAQRYEPKIFHIIRNPIDVYDSLMRIYDNKKGIKYFFRKLGHFIKKGYSKRSVEFRVDERIDYVYQNYGKPRYWGKIFSKYQIFKTPFKTHLLSWLLNNYYALKEKEELGIKIIPYEQLVSSPECIKQKVETNTDLNFNINEVMRKDICLDRYKAPKIMNVIKDLNMEKEYEFILEVIFN